VPPGTYSIPSPAGCTNDRPSSDGDFVSASFITNSGPRIEGLRCFIRDTAEELFRSLCSFGRNAITPIQSGRSAARAKNSLAHEQSCGRRPTMGMKLKICY
jgi:hypothetical protein